MPTLAEFSEMLVERLSLDSTYLYDTEQSVKRFAKKLLRDYNFPKSITSQTFSPLTAGQQSYALPAGCRKIAQVYFRDVSDPAMPAVGDPLDRREGIQRANADGIPRYYWIAGTQLWTDITISAEDAATTQLVLLYQSEDEVANLPWLLDDFHDILFTLSLFRLSSEHNKTELAAVWAALWQEDLRALAIYANELEFDHVQATMKTGERTYKVRYPVGENGY